MECDSCHERDAVVHLTQIVNEQVTTLHLCERCAAEKGVESTGSVAAKSEIGSFLAAMTKGLTDPALVPASGEKHACPRCGATLQDFREGGRLGCADCWRAFEVPLRDLLRRLHGSTVHMGERYARQSGEAQDPARRAAELKEQLRLAVETENFELAAELRDRLRVTE